MDANEPRERASRVAPALWLPALVCATWTVIAGKDVNWDLLNYHYYLPYELLHSRLEQDFFAASAQSYLNPLGYVPFYVMVSSGWHSVLVSIALAVLHGTSLTLLFLLARGLFAHLPSRERNVFSLLGTALGAATWVFWPTVGSTFLDPLLVPLMLGGLLLALEAEPRRAAFAGMLFGAAAALKYSNAIFLLAAFPLVCLRLRAAFLFIGGALLAVALLAGPWFALLLREFQNPVFPLFNGWFHSPDALPGNQASLRFAVGGLGEALALPFRMALLDRHLYAESFAPDLRIAALVLFALAMPLSRAPGQRRLTSTAFRVLAFFAIAWALWLATSANGRYGMAVLLLAGLLLARLVERILPPQAALITLAGLLVAQVAISVIAAPTRWYNAEPWSTQWLPYDAPERAKREAALYLSVEVQPMAVVAPFLNPASSFVNFRGQHSLPVDSPRLAALLARHSGHVRALGQRLQLTDGAPSEAAVRAYDTAFRQLGLRLDPQDCFSIVWRPRQDALSRAANFAAATLPSADPLSVGSCALRAAPRDPADVEAERRVSAVFAAIEQRCPALHGQSAVTEAFGTRGWLRHYNGLDARLEVLGERVVLHRFGRGEIDDLGRVDDWERRDAPLPAACGAGT